MYLDEEIFCYIGYCVEFDNELPDEDQIYTKFQESFEIGGVDTDIIEKMVHSYVRCSDLEGVEIKWEGKLDGIRNKGASQMSEIQQKTA